MFGWFRKLWRPTRKLTLVELKTHAITGAATATVKFSGGDTADYWTVDGGFTWHGNAGEDANRWLGAWLRDEYLEQLRDADA